MPFFQGRVSPHGSPPPPPLSPSDSEGGEEEPSVQATSTENLAAEADAESTHSTLEHTSSSDQAKSASSKATSRASSSKASSKATSRASTVKDDSSSPDASTIGQSVPLELDQGNFSCSSFFAESTLQSLFIYFLFFL